MKFIQESPALAASIAVDVLWCLFFYRASAWVLQNNIAYGILTVAACIACYIHDPEAAAVVFRQFLAFLVCLHADLHSTHNWAIPHVLAVIAFLRSRSVYKVGSMASYTRRGLLAALGVQIVCQLFIDELVEFAPFVILSRVVYMAAIFITSFQNSRGNIPVFLTREIVLSLHTVYKR